MVNQCRECGSYNIKVVDSREHDGYIWRRRMCVDCGKRMSTIEVEREQYLKNKEFVECCVNFMNMLKEICDGE